MRGGSFFVASADAVLDRQLKEAHKGAQENDEGGDQRRDLRGVEPEIHTAAAGGDVLDDRMSSILNWSKENSGKKVDAMFAELSGVPVGTDEESKQAAADAYAPYTADMIWLMEQGFILVTNDNSVWFPKGKVAPAT